MNPRVCSDACMYSTMLVVVSASFRSDFNNAVVVDFNSLILGTDLYVK